MQFQCIHTYYSGASSSTLSAKVTAETIVAKYLDPILFGTLGPTILGHFILHPNHFKARWTTSWLIRTHMWRLLMASFVHNWRSLCSDNCGITAWTILIHAQEGFWPQHFVHSQSWTVLEYLSMRLIQTFWPLMVSAHRSVCLQGMLQGKMSHFSRHT